MSETSNPIQERNVVRRWGERMVRVLAAGALVLTAGCEDSEAQQGVAPDGCDMGTVYAQNRWPPAGASVRDKPDITGEKVASVPGGQAMETTGWVETGVAAYPDNPPEWQGREWLLYTYEAGKDGWVTSAAVRAEQDEDYDPTGLEPANNRPAALPTECELSLSSVN